MEAEGGRGCLEPAGARAARGLTFGSSVAEALALARETPPRQAAGVSHHGYNWVVRAFAQGEMMRMEYVVG